MKGTEFYLVTETKHSHKSAHVNVIDVNLMPSSAWT